MSTLVRGRMWIGGAFTLALTGVALLGVVAATGQWGGGDDPDVTLAEIQSLRSAGEYAQAQFLAGEFLDSYQERDLTRQAVHYEYAKAFYRQGDRAAARAEFEALRDDYEASTPDATDEAILVDDAAFYHAVIRIIQGEYREARQEFLDLRSRWPTSNEYARAAQFAARALIQEEIMAWRPRHGVIRQAESDNWETVSSDIEALLESDPPADVAASALLDQLNYLSSRQQWAGRTGPPIRSEIVRIVTRMIEVAPEARATYVGKLELALALFYEDRAESHALVREVQDHAAAMDDVSLLTDALIMEANLLRGERRWAASARVLQGLIDAGGMPPLLEGELLLEIASGYAQQEMWALALEAYGDIAADERFPTDVWASAMMGKARAAKEVGDAVTARACLQQVVYADTGLDIADLAAEQLARYAAPTH